MSESTTSGHWDAAYGKGAASRSWYQPEATESLEFIASTGAGAGASIVDVGGGASTLVDGLLQRGHQDVTVLDLAAGGMCVARERLGDQAAGVAWVVADVVAWTPGRTFDVWHDRAVLHFLTADEDRDAYAAVAAASVAPGGWATIGGFAPDGPTSCSGLPVRGASADELAELLSGAFDPISSASVTHTTPAGHTQQFAWLIARRRSQASRPPRADGTLDRTTCGQ
jgi:hypothetical protein